LAEAPRPGLGVAARPDGPESDRHPVERTRLHQREYLLRARHAGRKHAFDIKPARILADRPPGADWLGRVVLVEHAHAARAALDERVQEGAALDPVLAEVNLAEDAGITGKNPVAGDPGQFQIGEFARSRPRPAVSVHEISPRNVGICPSPSWWRLPITAAARRHSAPPTAPARPSPTRPKGWRQPIRSASPPRERPGRRSPSALRARTPPARRR